MSKPVKISSRVLGEMLAHASNQAPAECCGLLAGSQDVITDIFPAVNALASGSEYFIAPQELVAALRTMRELRLGHLGIYHSHPHSENFPSRRDIDLAYYPACAYFIAAPQKPVNHAIRAFEIRSGCVTELEIQAV